MENRDNKLDPLDHGRGLADDSAEPRFLVIGRILKPHGVRGELRVEILTESPERYDWLERVFVGENEPEPYQVESVRFHKTWVLLKLAGCDNRNSANLLRSQLVQIPESEGIPLENGEYYLFQLIGLDVFSEEGENLGRITEVLETNANNVFVVNGEKGEILIPDIEDVVRLIDFDRSRVEISPLPGLIP